MNLGVLRRNEQEWKNLNMNQNFSAQALIDWEFGFQRYKNFVKEVLQQEFESAWKPEFYWDFAKKAIQWKPEGYWDFAKKAIEWKPQGY